MAQPRHGSAQALNPGRGEPHHRHVGQVDVVVPFQIGNPVGSADRQSHLMMPGQPLSQYEGPFIATATVEFHAQGVDGNLHNTGSVF